MGCIVTFTVFRNTNYGALLQAYALQKTLIQIQERPVYLIDYIRDENTNLMHNGVLFYGRHRKKTINCRSLKKACKSVLNYYGTVVRTKQFQKFVREYLAVYPVEFYSDDSIYIDNLEYILLGSDQIWNPDITHGFQKQYFGVTNSKPRKVIAYAPSIGKLTFSESEKNQLNELLQNVDVLSCREQQSCEILEKLSGRNVTCVLDPTLLLERDAWERIIDYSCDLPPKYILVYSLRNDQNLTQAAVEKAQKAGCVVIFLGNGHGKRPKGAIYCKAFGPQQFLAAISGAEYVYTDSFHGTVFSIIFHKKFVTKANGEKGQRMEDLCNKLMLGDRVYRDNNKQPEIDSEINYQEIDKKLLQYRDESVKYIRKSLEI